MRQSIRILRCSKYNRGAAVVEMAIVMMLLLMLVLGIVEFGFMFRNYLSLNEIARAGARSASLGSSTTVITNRVNQTVTAVGLKTQYVTGITMDYRTYTKASGTWSGWSTLSNSGSYNNAPCDVNTDSQVRVKVTYRYPLITGSFFTSVIGSNGYATLSGTGVMRREETP